MTNFNNFNGVYNTYGSPMGQATLGGTFRDLSGSTIGRVDALGNLTRLDGGYTGATIGRTNHIVGPGGTGFTFTPGPRF